MLAFTAAITFLCFVLKWLETSVGTTPFSVAITILFLYHAGDRKIIIMLKKEGFNFLECGLVLIMLAPFDSPKTIENTTFYPWADELRKR